MSPSDLKAYRERWKAVEDVERRERQSLTMEQKWQQLLMLYHFAGAHLNLREMAPVSQEEMGAILRWATLRRGNRGTH